MPPVLYSSLEEFIEKYQSISKTLSLEKLLSLFIVPEVLDYILSEDVLAVIQEIFSSLPSEDDGVNAELLINSLFENEIIQQNLEITARSPQGLPSIPEESLERLLLRIKEEAPQ